MRFKLFFILFAAMLFTIAPASAEDLAFINAPDMVYPGKAEPITFTLPSDGALTMEVIDANGNHVLYIRDGYDASAGSLTVTFNGCTLQGQALAQGNYYLRLSHLGKEAIHPFAISAPAPVLSNMRLDHAQLLLGDTPTLSFTASVEGNLNILLLMPSGTAQPGGAYAVKAGENTLALDPALFTEGGDYQLSLTLTNANGLSGNTSLLGLSITIPATPTPPPIIRPGSEESETISADFWSMEVGNYDWQAIWEVMIAPMTIIEGSGKEAQKQTYKLRLTPDDSSSRDNIVGEITCESQGVNVLETLDNGWTYIEAYNSSYGPDNRNRRGYGETDALIRGYVETDRLATFTPATEYGLLIDKLTQRLYIVKDGKLFTTLLISTGFPTDEQPWNETPAGEFYLCSKVGDFPSGNMTCGYGMRFNSGDILHEVPYLMNEKYNIRDYSYTERYLGEKASHGCVRVQRKKNDDGINMKWIWDNVPLKTKLLIWDDTGRPIDYPKADDYSIYYNPDGGKYYHAEQNCDSIKSRYLPLEGIITYGVLDNEEYAHFTPCSHCDPPVRKRDIDAINAENGF